MKQLLLGAALALIASNILAGHHEEAESAAMEDAAMMNEDPMMQAMQKASTPGEAHAHLARSVGSYSAQMNMYMEPGGEPMVTEMAVERVMDLGGRVLVEHWKGEVMGAPFEGRSRTGFDNVTQRFWSTWSDNMSTGLLVMYGAWDETQKTMVFNGESVHPMTGETYTMRSVGMSPTPGREEMTMYEDHGEGEYKSMSFVLTRK